MRRITVDGWKLVRDFKNLDRDELYHLDEDPRKSKNLIHSNTLQVTRVIRELHGQLVRRMKQHGGYRHLNSQYVVRSMEMRQDAFVNGGGFGLMKMSAIFSGADSVW